MTVYNFKKQFADDVESGRKTQTIRAERKDCRVQPVGGALQLYTGMRTKSCRKLRDAVCTSVHEIVITEFNIRIDGHWCYPYEADDLAIADGFSDWIELLAFFEEEHGFPFKGHLIKWQ